MAFELRSFLGELKRRHVYTVGAAYVVVGLGVLGAAELILDPLGLEGARPYVVVVTLLGFPLALVLAWAYELTPDGVRRDPTLVADPRRTPDAIIEAPDAGDSDDAVPSVEEKSIAVLPFDNKSDDAEQEYFSDGISEDLTVALSRFDWLFVVARNSAFAYRGEAADLKRIGRELGVRYILSGSVRRAGSRIRINAQLMDSRTDRQVWAERFDREMDDVFELQDDIVARIARTLGPEITLAEIERTREKRPETFTAWDHYLQATAAYHRMTKKDLEAGTEHLEKALEIDPGFASAHALLGLYHAHIGVNGWVRPASRAFAKARTLVETAVRLAPASAEANYAKAFVLSVTGEADEAVVVARRATELNPNFAEAYAVLGQALAFKGDLDGALEACRQAERSSPRDLRGSWLHDIVGHIHFFHGDYEEAIRVSRRLLHRDPSVLGGYVTLACSYAQLGQKKEAQQYVDAILKLIPRYSLRALRKNPMFQQPDMVNKLVKSMRMAGLPE